MISHRALGLIAALLLFVFHAHSQVVTSIDVKIVDSDLVVTYQMSGVQENQEFDVELYGNHNEYSAPMTGPGIQGAVGDRIRIKDSNDIVIKNPLQVLGQVTRINFKVKVDLVYNPVRITSPSMVFSQRKKKDMSVVWMGGIQREEVKFDLYKDGFPVLEDFHKTTNNGSTEFKMPKVKNGPGYQLRMDFESLPSAVELPEMTVKSKKSVAARVINIALLLAAVDFALYASGDGTGGFLFTNFDPLGKIEDDPGGVTGGDTLPDAPGPPTRARFTIPLFR